MAACAKVFATTELLERILLKLPMKDQLFAQRLSKHVKATIDNSVMLQRALFLQDTPPPQDGKRVKPVVNPLFATVHDNRWSDPLHVWYWQLTFGDVGIVDGAYEIGIFAWRTNGNTSDNCEDGEASFSKMLITNKPCKTKVDMGLGVMRMDSIDLSGLRLGELIERLDLAYADWRRMIR